MYCLTNKACTTLISDKRSIKAKRKAAVEIKLACTIRAWQEQKDTTTTKLFVAVINDKLLVASACSLAIAILPSEYVQLSQFWLNTIQKTSVCANVVPM